MAASMSVPMLGIERARVGRIPDAELAPGVGILDEEGDGTLSTKNQLVLELRWGACGRLFELDDDDATGPEPVLLRLCSSRKDGSGLPGPLPSAVAAEDELMERKAVYPG